jgi:hypothetical protein
MNRFARMMFAALLLLLALPTPSAFANYLNCVQYVRQVSQIDISGNAWMWWNNAKGRYNIGHHPTAIPCWCSSGPRRCPPAMSPSFGTSSIGGPF